MNKLQMVYIDDNIEVGLSDYLANYKKEGYKFVKNEIEFLEQNYKDLIEDKCVKTADIIFIDSRLFEKSKEDRFTGEEFKIVLKQEYPFIEVIVVTQNDISDNYTTVQKSPGGTPEENEEYYNKVLSPKIDTAIKSRVESMEIINNIKNKGSVWDDLRKSKLSNSIAGSNIYNDLSKKDINKVINIFNEIQEKLKNERL